MNPDELVTVYTLNNPVRAELIRNMLADEGIRCFLNGLEQAADVGFALNEIQVQVPGADALRARKLIDEHGG